MTYATWANGKRAAQKELNELPPQFTQFLTSSTTDTARSLSVTCKDANKSCGLTIFKRYC
jgi:hypothetical protein